MQCLPVIEDSFAKDNVKLSILRSCAGGALCLWQSTEKYTLFKFADFCKSDNKTKQKTQTQTQQSVKEKYLWCLG